MKESSCPTCCNWRDPTCSFFFSLVFGFWIITSCRKPIFSVLCGCQAVLDFLKESQRNVSLWEIAALWSTNERFHDLWSQEGQIRLRNPIARLRFIFFSALVNCPVLLLEVGGKKDVVESKGPAQRFPTWLGRQKVLPDSGDPEAGRNGRLLQP